MSVLAEHPRHHLVAITVPGLLWDGHTNLSWFEHVNPPPGRAANLGHGPTKPMPVVFMGALRRGVGECGVRVGGDRGRNFAG